MDYKPGTFVVVVRTGDSHVWELATTTEAELIKLIAAVKKEMGTSIQRIIAVEITTDPMKPRPIMSWERPTVLN